MFKEVGNTLTMYDAEETVAVQENSALYEDKVINEGSLIRLDVPADK